MVLTFILHAIPFTRQDVKSACVISHGKEGKRTASASSHRTAQEEKVAAKDRSPLPWNPLLYLA